MLTHARLLSLLALASLLLGSAGAAAQTELKNDNFVSGGAATFMGGFVPGEIGASRFVPTGPCTITKIQLLFGGAATAKTVTLHIYDDAAETVIPGAELMAATDVDLTGSNSAMNEIDVTALGTVTASGPFRVGLEWKHTGFPSIANDSDGMTYANRNFIREANGTWRQSSFFLVKGDWIVRAWVVYGGAQDDAGVAQDAGAPLDAAHPADGGGSSCQGNTDCPGGQYCGPQNACTHDCVIDTDCGDDSTCNSLGQCVAKGSSGCSLGTPGTRAAPFGALLLLGVAGGALRRRRRRP